MTNYQATFRAQPPFTDQQKLLIKEMWSFSFAINLELLLNRQYTKIQLSQKHFGAKFKITNHK